MTRIIIHIDLDAFFCAVEELFDPNLHGTAFAVGGLPDQRGVVSSCSYTARKFGVHSGMPMAKALKICSNLKIIRPKFKKYEQYSKNVIQLLSQYTPLVEQISIDEAFLDVSDLLGSSEALAHQIQQKVKELYKLPSSLGVASNKLVAKIATDVGKSRSKRTDYPYAITIVPTGAEQDFLAPLPVSALIGVGPKTASKMDSMGIHTIGDLAGRAERELTDLFGKFGHELFLHSKGIDDRPLVTSHKVKSISTETTFPKDIKDEKLLRSTLLDLTQAVCKRLDISGLKGSTIRLKLRWADFTTITRQATFDSPTDQEALIYAKVCELFEMSWRTRERIRLLGISVSNLDTVPKQLSLWDAINSAKEEKLSNALHNLEIRFGKKIIQRGIVNSTELTENKD
jgi:DNA polymerase-4